ncbi:hypothetical protein PTB13_14570 [Bacillus sp. MHSD17]|nr:hypothetical protein [Bacillus sp. MHSD17]
MLRTFVFLRPLGPPTYHFYFGKSDFFFIYYLPKTNSATSSKIISLPRGK